MEVAESFIRGRRVYKYDHLADADASRSIEQSAPLNGARPSAQSNRFKNRITRTTFHPVSFGSPIYVTKSRGVRMKRQRATIETQYLFIGYDIEYAQEKVRYVT